jgi:pyruvate/2-oxoglutarate/acetoin dehydrogenase E1 component
MSEKIMIRALNEALHEEMGRDENVFVIGEDVAKMGGSWQVTAGLLQKYGAERVIDTPISEMGYTAMSLGQTLMGRRPVIEVMFADMLTFAYDSIVNQATKFHYMTGGLVDAPIVIRAAQGVGGGIGCQHSQSTEGWFMNVPGIKIISPSTPADAKGLLKSAIRDNNPVLFLEHKALYKMSGDVPDGEYVIPIGKASRVKEGKDLTIIASQVMLRFALAIVPELEKEGISVEVIDPRTIKPFDRDMLCESAKKTGRVMIIHENCREGGYGAEMAATIYEECLPYLKKPVARLGGADSCIPYGPAEWFLFPNKDTILQTARDLMK